MTNKSNPIHDALGLTPIEESTPVTEVEETHQGEIVEYSGDDHPFDDETLKDIELARSNIKKLLETGVDSLDDIVELAKQSESPRAFEVASGIMKTLLDANKQFIETAEKKKATKDSLMNPKDNQNVTNITNNTLVLSTTELLKKIKEESKE